MLAYKMRFITFTNSLVVVTIGFMYTEVREVSLRDCTTYQMLRCTSYDNDAQMMDDTIVQLLSFCSCNERLWSH